LVNRETLPGETNLNSAVHAVPIGGPQRREAGAWLGKVFGHFPPKPFVPDEFSKVKSQTEIIVNAAYPPGVFFEFTANRTISDNITETYTIRGARIFPT
jgi:hypothetical protein